MAIRSRSRSTRALGLATLVFLFFMTPPLKRREREGVAAEPTWLREISRAVPVAELEAARSLELTNPASAKSAALKAEASEIAMRNPTSWPSRWASGSRNSRVDGRGDHTGRPSAAGDVRPAKAAMLCVSLGPEAAAEIMRELPQDLVELLTIEMVRTPTVNGQAADSVLEEVVQTAQPAATCRRAGSRTRGTCSRRRSARRRRRTPLAPRDRDRGDAVRVPARRPRPTRSRPSCAGASPDDRARDREPADTDARRPRDRAARRSRSRPTSRCGSRSMGAAPRRTSSARSRA